MHVKTLKGAVIMSFVPSTKVGKKKNLPQFFFFSPDFEGGVKKRKTHIWPSFSSEHFA